MIARSVARRSRLVASVAVALAGCQSLPTAGPSRDQVQHIKPENNPLGVKLLALTPEVVATLRAHPVQPASIIDSPAQGRRWTGSVRGTC